MSKYTRLNKINHYHDCSSINKQQQQHTSSDKQHTPTLNYYNYVGSRDRNINTATRIANINRKMHPPQSNRRSVASSLALGASILLVIIAINGLENVARVEALNCYHCSSVDNPGCDETFNSTSGGAIQSNCEEAIGKPAKVCRKIVQYIEAKRVVIRSCGYIDEHDEKDRRSMCNKRSGTFAIMMESCNCYTDLCNHSASLVPHHLSVIILSLLAGISIFTSHYYFSTLPDSRKQ